MHSRILFDDPEAAKRVIHHFDPATGQATIETAFDVEPIIERATAIRNQEPDYRPFSRDVSQHHVATIPMPMFMELSKTGILNDAKAFMGWLDLHSKLKMTNKRIG